MDFMELCFISVGACVVLLYGGRIVSLVMMLSPKVWYPLPRSFFTSMGEWAVITGGSDGIGRAYALELAKHGMNVVIISRSLEKLEKAAREIEDTTGQKVKVIVADFTEDAGYEYIKEKLESLNIGILVNNVGILPSHIPCKFLQTEDLGQRINKVINCNVKTVVKMCKIALPGMERREKGVILNISSGIAKIPCPVYTMYAASKVFIERFSQGLQAEYTSKGIIVQTVAPFGVSTSMTGYQKPNMITFTPEEFVRASLMYLKVGDRTSGSFCHTILDWILQAIPVQVLYSDAVQDQFLEYVKQRVAGNL